MIPESSSHERETEQRNVEQETISTAGRCLRLLTERENGAGDAIAYLLHILVVQFEIKDLGIRFDSRLRNGFGDGDEFLVKAPGIELD